MLGVSRCKDMTSASACPIMDKKAQFVILSFHPAVQNSFAV